MVGLTELESVTSCVRGKLSPSTKGAISESMVLAAFLSKGVSIAIPWGNSQPYDFVVDAGTLLKVQVKTGRIKAGAIVFNCYTQDRRGRRVTYRGRVDLYAVHVPGSVDVYLIPVALCGTATAQLRIEPTKNNQSKSIKVAANFHIDEWVRSGMHV